METSVLRQREPEQNNCGENDRGPRLPCPRPITNGMRRSCDRCGLRKKKCNGERPCRLCLRAGSDCTYSKRRWHIRPLQRNGVDTVQDIQFPGSCRRTLPEHHHLPLKRCRLSASPATGLVGMQENAFLGDFFDCLGFLPLTTQSDIRGTMVQIMTAPVLRQRPASRNDCGAEGGGFDAALQEGKFSVESGGCHLPRKPSTCVFWCAVALGALIRGNPIDSVSVYSQLATEALTESYSDLADVEVAMAWNSLAYLHGVMGDMARFHEYLTRSDSFLTASIKEGSADMLPVGFAEIIERKTIANDCSGIPPPPEMELSHNREHVKPQLNQATNGPELYRYVIQSMGLFEEAVSDKISGNTRVAEHSGSIEGTVLPKGTHIHPNPLSPEDVSDAMWSVIEDDIAISFESLEETIDRSGGFGGGLGGILINGVLIFEKIWDGDLHGTLERMDRCAEVFVQYPGLCCPVFGLHIAHNVLVALVAIGNLRAIGLYDKLRAAYNSSRLAGSVPVPPFEEWQGIPAICEDVSCRAIENLFIHRCRSVFSIPSDSFTGAEENNAKYRTSSHGPGRQNQNRPMECGHTVPEVTMSSTSHSSGSCETDETLSFYDPTRQSPRIDHSPESKVSNSTAALPLDNICGGSEIGLSDISMENGVDSIDCRVVDLVVPGSETISVGSPSWRTERLQEEQGIEVAAADWLDVFHALS